MPLKVQVSPVGRTQVLHEQTVPPSSPQLRWDYGQNPALHITHATHQLDFAVWSITQPAAAPLLFTMDASKTNHITLLCRQAFIEECSPTTMIFVGKHLPAWNRAT